MPGNAAWQFMIARSGGSGRRAWWRMAAAMLAWPASRTMVMARLRRAAMMRGLLAVRTWERSSPESMSRTQ